MTTTQLTNLVQDFAAAPLELRRGSWFGRWWRDPGVETRTDQHRQLRTFAFDHTDTRGRINQLELLIQESTLLRSWKIYRIVIAPCARPESGHVIVLVPNILNFQIAINLLICLARVEFYAKDDLQRYFSEPNVNAHCKIVRPVGEWPPRTDRIAEDTQIYSNTKFRRLSTAYIPESDLEADIVLCHGLGGDLMRTWTCPSDTAGFLGVDRPWPANQLLDGSHSIYRSGLSLPPRHHIRVITVGHALSFRAANDGITDSIDATIARIWASMRSSGVGKCPMVWLGHSLGCLLLKEVLLFDTKQSKENRLYLEENLKGIIFYGGPHNGSVFAGALTDFFFEALRFRFHIGSPATAYLSTVSSLARNRHAEINKFFFDDLSVPFINFRESKGVKLTARSTVTQIVKNEESDVNEGGIRTVQSGYVLKDVSVEGFRKTRIQLLVEHHHLDICAPQWSDKEPPDIYIVSRDAIAAWLCKQTKPSPRASPEPTVDLEDPMLFAELFSEVLAMLHAVSSLAMPGGVSTPNEALTFRCAWSHLPVISHRVVDLESDIPTDLQAELQRLSLSLSQHKKGLAALSQMAFKAVAAPALWERLLTSLVLQSLLRTLVPPAILAAVLAVLDTILGRASAGDITISNVIILSNAESEFAIKRPDFIQLVDALRIQLRSVFDRLRTDSLILWPEIKHTMYRRCRDIIFAQLCADHVPADNEDILGQAIARLEDRQMRKIIAECQMHRAKARHNARLPV